MHIPYQRHQLANGLQVLLHVDPRLPRVVVNVLYKVGSRHDPSGLTGVAHLFEHLMFMGTRRIPEGAFDLLMEQHGGANNAFTSEDLTDYYSAGPSRLLETLLWLEADRMASLARAMTQAKLDLQREVVLNERRQSYENAPYGRAFLELPELLYPAAHPYSWPVIGSSEHLRAVTVSDLKALFSRSYSPQNASLVVAGQIDPQQALELVRRYFGWIPAGPAADERPPARLRRRRSVSRTMTDRVELARLFWIWHSPRHLAPGDAELDLTAAVLGTGKKSRLYRELVFERKLALDVEVQQESRQLGSLFSVEITARPGADRQQIEQAAEQVLRELLAAPPSAAELERAKNVNEMQFVSMLERLTRRAELLNLYWAAVGEPDYLQQDLARYRRAHPRDLHRWCRTCLKPEQRLSLWVVPEEGRRDG